MGNPILGGPAAAAAPAKRPEYTRGELQAVPHDKPSQQAVIGFYAANHDEITATIPKGAKFITVAEVIISDLVRVSEPDLRPPRFVWELEEAGRVSGSNPIAVTKGQWIEVTVQVMVPHNAIPPGPFTGELLVAGSKISRTLALHGTYLEVDPNTTIGHRWKALGGEAFFGEVKTNEHRAAPDVSGLIQTFANGALWDTGSEHASYLSAAVYEKWDSPSVQSTPTAAGDPIRHTLGLPKEDTMKTVEGGEVQYFQGGMIVVRRPTVGLANGGGIHAGTKVGGALMGSHTAEVGGGLTDQHLFLRPGAAWVVYGAIYTKYVSLGSVTDPSRLPVVGYPTTDETGTPDHRGRFNHFSAGSIYWTPQTDAHEVHGAIRDKWASLGWEHSLLGYPKTDETTTPDGRGRFNHFEGGSVYWTPQTGAHEVHGAIRDKWASLGWETSLLGYPTTDETAVSNGPGRFNHFEHGSVFWSPSTAAHEVHGAIRDKWASLGWENSYLGYPVSDELNWTDPILHLSGRISNFQWGRIAWTSAGGAIDLPDLREFNGTVTTPSGTALGGWVKVTVRANGTYTFEGHMHDSGFDPYSFRVRAVVRAGGGDNTVALFAQHTGHTAGTIGSGSRDDNWKEDGNNGYIRAHWPDIRNGSMAVSKSYEDTGVIGAAEAIAKDLLNFIIGTVLVGPELAIVIAISNEIAKAADISAGPGLIPGVTVAGGVVWIFGRGAILAAVVSGVAAGAVTNAMVKHRTMTQAEADFASKVYGNTLPSHNRITITNLSHDGGRAYTIPLPDGSVLMNMDTDFADPVHSQTGGYSAQGQRFIHECAHAWQIQNSDFIPLICKNVFETGSYDFGPAGPPWGSFGLEQQAAIVDKWFGKYAANVNSHDAINDPYFQYIANNIRAGQR